MVNRTTAGMKIYDTLGILLYRLTGSFLGPEGQCRRRSVIAKVQLGAAHLVIDGPLRTSGVFPSLL